MIALLCEANALTIEARAVGFAALPGPMVLDIQTRYDAILEVAKAHNSSRKLPPGTRKRVRQSPAYHLAKRLSEKREAVLRFVTDLCVPVPYKAHTTTSPSATSGCPSSSRRSPDASAPFRGARTSQSSALTSPPCENSPLISSSPWS